MSYWLVKSEPFKYSWHQFERDKRTIWDGVRNYQARNNLKMMKKGDKVFFYHSNEDLSIMGIAIVAKPFFTDPTSNDMNWVAVELEVLQKLKFPVLLSKMKLHDGLKDLMLLRQPRLSVSPIHKEQWRIIINLSKIG